ncbi:hypothetical protein [Ruminiclostridium cellobioparum]|uniref:Uncharacterized protein n=1 Tax=Ruminiclostridium cellobioparum subsp. termitidis CT1112 TaxID=1195236 RepID=S0FN63_RUMCE|nr:hypothetical protein [Ruminiclostridium cellobioparum]EMS70574.1 hypothetical protein CTER_3657 [Ruminiclostridium cellobioparum subsp. termitidis CT1112]
MNIDQKSLNDLLSIMRPKNSLDTLRERREALLKRMDRNTPVAGNPSEGDKNTGDIKQVLMELGEIDRQIQAEIYEEKTRKLELERLKREEAAAKNLREREKILARHEGVLYRYSFNKLLSADGKAREMRTMVGPGVSVTLSGGISAEGKAHGDKLVQKLEDIDRDLKESREFGIAAAEVAARRRRNRMKQEIEEAALAKSRNRKIKAKKHINVVL